MSQLFSPPISLSQAQRDALERIVRKHTSPTCKVTRAKIILLADEDYGVRETSRGQSISRNQVLRWRKQRLSAPGLIEDVSQVLSDAYQTGAPATYTPEQICAIVAMACEYPSVRDRPIVYFPQQEIADEAIKRGIVDNIRKPSTGRFLNEADLQPQSKRGWLTPKQDEQFFEPCQDICETYKQAPEREKNGEKTISIDIIPGILCEGTSSRNETCQTWQTRASRI